MTDEIRILEFRIKKLEDDIKEQTEDINKLRDHMSGSIKEALHEHYINDRALRDQVTQNQETIRNMPQAIASAVISQLWIGILGPDMAEGNDAEKHKRAIQEFCRNAARFSPYITQSKIWVFLIFLSVGLLTFGKLVFEIIRTKLGFPNIVSF